jgi:hypothetical protein
MIRSSSKHTVRRGCRKSKRAACAKSLPKRMTAQQLRRMATILTGRFPPKAVVAGALIVILNPASPGSGAKANIAMGPCRGGLSVAEPPISILARSKAWPADRCPRAAGRRPQSGCSRRAAAALFLVPSIKIPATHRRADGRATGTASESACAVDFSRAIAASAIISTPSMRGPPACRQRGERLARPLNSTSHAPRVMGCVRASASTIVRRDGRGGWF